MFIATTCSYRLSSSVNRSNGSLVAAIVGTVLVTVCFCNNDGVVVVAAAAEAAVVVAAAAVAV
jgi:hypothetical protein